MGGGFEPPKASPTDLQSVPFDHSGTPPERYFHTWSQRQELNPRHPHYKWGALPTELLWQLIFNLSVFRNTSIRHKKRSLDKSPFILKAIIKINLYFSLLIADIEKYDDILFVFFKISPFFIVLNIIYPNANKNPGRIIYIYLTHIVKNKLNIGNSYPSKQHI